MRIVVDTNVVISGLFFGGYPRKIIDAIIEDKCQACATLEIIVEYEKVIDEVNEQYGNTFSGDLYYPFISKLDIVIPKSSINICRDADDNKFIECAIDSNSIFLISGDKDLLIIKQHEFVEILTAKEFYEKYLDIRQDNEPLN